MNLNNSKLSIYIILIFLFSFIKPDNSSLQSNIFIGYDSNPLRLSDDEINQLNISIKYAPNTCQPPDYSGSLRQHDFSLRHPNQKMASSFNFTSVWPKKMT